MKFEVGDRIMIPAWKHNTECMNERGPFTVVETQICNHIIDVFGRQTIQTLNFIDEEEEIETLYDTFAVLYHSTLLDKMAYEVSK
jgi:hypothetical protein